jgi:hypothetical protein
MIFEFESVGIATAAMRKVWPSVLRQLQEGKRIKIEIKRAKRTVDQNSMFHVIIHKIYLQMKEAGSNWSQDDWKRLLIDQWAADTNRHKGIIVPSLDGLRIVQLGIQSHKFTKPDAAEFIEWLYAWCAEKEIEC